MCRKGLFSFVSKTAFLWIQLAVAVAGPADQQVLEFAAVFDFALDKIVLLQLIFRRC